MLRLNNIEVIYSDVILVLKGLSLEVPQGQIVALLGANGAGKTTTLKAISGLLKTENGQVTNGSVELMGRRIDGMDPDRICRLGILQVMEGRKVLESLTVEENLRIGGYTRRDPDSLERDFQMIYEYFPRLVERRHQLAGYLSGGEQQMLVIGRALMAQPKLLLLDEPSLGLAPLLVREISASFRKSMPSTARPVSWSSRMLRSLSVSRIMATSWRTAGSSWTVLPRCCGATRTCVSSIWGSVKLGAARVSKTSSSTNAASAGYSKATPLPCPPV
jgi:branched-chain amino acid transport system ATP-binding protein